MRARCPSIPELPNLLSGMLFAAHGAEDMNFHCKGPSSQSAIPEPNQCDSYMIPTKYKARVVTML